MADNDNIETEVDSNALVRETEDFLGTVPEADPVDTDVVRFHQLSKDEERFPMVGATLGDLLQKKGLTLADAEVLYNGVRTTNLEQQLEAGSLVYFAERIRGGRI